ncbi:hypothetical protein ACSFCT_09320 [Yokenella regensburgei]|uniref:hypothetical protein n=1 Tax=Yokenella regensburgei TaxID=158877 RepID=UPI003ED8778C
MNKLTPDDVQIELILKALEKAGYLRSHTELGQTETERMKALKITVQTALTAFRRQFRRPPITFRY